VAKALDLQLEGCDFNSRPRRYQVTTVRKLFTPMCLSRLQWFSDGMIDCGARGRGQLFITTAKVQPMYTLDIENRQHRRMLEHRRIGIGKSLMSMLSKIVALLRSPNFHRHRGGWLPQNLTVFLAVFLGAVS